MAIPMPVPDSSREALAAVDRYLAALNARDTAAIRDAFNFPHLRIVRRRPEAEARTA